MGQELKSFRIRGAAREVATGRLFKQRSIIWRGAGEVDMAIAAQYATLVEDAGSILTDFRPIRTIGRRTTADEHSQQSRLW